MFYSVFKRCVFVAVNRREHVELIKVGKKLTPECFPIKIFCRKKPCSQLQSLTKRVYLFGAK